MIRLKSLLFLLLAVIILHISKSKVVPSHVKKIVSKDKRGLSNTCSIKVSKVGCYRDSSEDRALKTILFTDRAKIQWENWETYLNGLVCRCANETYKKGYTHFGIQYYGECHSGPDSETRYKMYNTTTNCVNTSYGHCDDNSDSACAGKGWANYVYQLGLVCKQVGKIMDEGSIWYRPGIYWDQCDQCTCQEGKVNCHPYILGHKCYTPGFSFIKRVSSNPLTVAKGFTTEIKWSAPYGPGDGVNEAWFYYDNSLDNTGKLINPKKLCGLSMGDGFLVGPDISHYVGRVNVTWFNYQVILSIRNVGVNDGAYFVLDLTHRGASLPNLTSDSIRLVVQACVLENGTLIDEGSIWYNLGGDGWDDDRKCDQCMCKGGKISCHPYTLGNGCYTPGSPFITTLSHNPLYRKQGETIDIDWSYRDPTTTWWQPNEAWFYYDDSLDNDGRLLSPKQLCGWDGEFHDGLDISHYRGRLNVTWSDYSYDITLTVSNVGLNDGAYFVLDLTHRGMSLPNMTSDSTLLVVQGNPTDAPITETGTPLPTNSP